MGQGDSFGDGSQGFPPDQKDEFGNLTSTSTGISQIFRDGKFGGKGRIALLSLVLILLAGGGVFYYYTMEPAADTDGPLVSEDDKEQEDPAAKLKSEEKHEDVMGKNHKVESPSNDLHDKAQGELAKADPAQKTVEAAVPAKEEQKEKEDVAEETAVSSPVSKGPAATVKPTLTAPENGVTRIYNEVTEAPEFSWNTDAGSWILFSRSPKMKPVHFKVWVKGQSFKFSRALPGVWFWRVSNAAGQSEIRSFTVKAPPRRSLVLTSPTEAGVIAGTGGLVSWSGSRYVTYYRVELSTGDWTHLSYKFATSGTALALKSVAAGPYELRIGAFSEVSGRWEYTNPIKVTVQ
ncbi:MAG: hypothetical protein KA436_06655 [Oligoflexales bacterium]|nr:hypothetical protein [Oligoflexales bacterium]